MTNEEIMELALEEAQKSSEFVGCGVVIVKDGQIIAKTHNLQRATNNATAHAEINAIKEAGQKLGSKNLDNCEIYCTCEPCTMCLSAIIFAKISKLFYGTSMLETFPDNLPITLTTNELLSHANHKIEVVGGILKEECKKLLASNGN